jgi:hypothetical protein
MAVNPDSIIVSVVDDECVIRARDHGVVAAGASYHFSAATWFCRR